MKIITKLLLLSFATMALANPALAKHDPLSRVEIDQLREAAQDAPVRLKLYVQFIRARMGTVLQLRSDPRFAGERAPQIHNLLEDITDLIDEMDDNIDTYVERRADLRKPLKDVIEADSELQLKLRGLKESATQNSALAEETKQYSFVLDNALEAVNSSLDNARKVLEQQEAAFKAAKEAKEKKK